MYDRTAVRPGWVWDYRTALQVARGLEREGSLLAGGALRRLRPAGTRAARRGRCVSPSRAAELGNNLHLFLAYLTNQDLRHPSAGHAHLWRHLDRRPTKVSVLAESFGIPLHSARHRRPRSRCLYSGGLLHAELCVPGNDRRTRAAGGAMVRGAEAHARGRGLPHRERDTCCFPRIRGSAWISTKPRFRSIASVLGRRQFLAASSALLAPVRALADAVKPTSGSRVWMSFRSCSPCRRSTRAPDAWIATWSAAWIPVPEYAASSLPGVGPAQTLPPMRQALGPGKGLFQIEGHLKENGLARWAGVEHAIWDAIGYIGRRPRRQTAGRQPSPQSRSISPRCGRAMPTSPRFLRRAGGDGPTRKERGVPRHEDSRLAA